MSAPSPEPRSQSDIDAEASLWLAQRRMQSPAEFDQVGFDAWLAADARHQATYALMVRAEDAVAVVDIKTPSRKARGIMSWRLAAPVGALAMAAAAAVFVLGGPLLEPPGVTHTTEVAELERLNLPDGSVVTLGAASNVEVVFSERERRVRLIAGEAFFDVTHDPSRPFFVEAADTVVRVVGTKFDVRLGAERVRVAVAEGVVQVRSAASPFRAPQVVLLRAGGSAELAEFAPLFGASELPLVGAAPPGSAGAWAQGRLVYVEAPLSELVADLNRYYPAGVRLADPELANYKLTASFQVGEVETFFATLPDAAPVDISRDAAGRVTIATRE